MPEALKRDLESTEVIEKFIQGLRDNSEKIEILLKSKAYKNEIKGPVGKINSYNKFFTYRLKDLKNNEEKQLSAGSEEILFNPRGDGNCFYAAVLHNNQDTSRTIGGLRNQIADHITNYSDDYFESIIMEAFDRFINGLSLNNFFYQEDADVSALWLHSILDALQQDGSFDLSRVTAEARSAVVKGYANNVRQNGVWAGEIEIGITARLLGQTILVHRPNGEIVQFGVIGLTEHINLYLLHNHYVRVSGVGESVFGNNIKVEEEKKKELAKKEENLVMDAKLFYQALIKNILAESDNMGGTTQVGKGMSCEAVNMNLVEMCKANNNKELKISPEVIDGATVAFSIKDWLNDDEVITKFTAVVKVENENGCSHAITVIAKRDGR